MLTKYLFVNYTICDITGLKKHSYKFNLQVFFFTQLFYKIKHLKSAL